MFYKVRCWLQKYFWAEAARKSILANLYQAKPPPRSQRVLDTRFLVVDCEMTGLDCHHDSLLSIGWVEVNGDRIELGTSHHSFIYSTTPVGGSASIHGIQDPQVAGAASVAKVLAALSKQALGKVLVFHHAALDIAFLQKAALNVLGCPFYFSYVDTLSVERRRLALRNKNGALQLDACRQRYGLPRALQHNAMLDARSTAELFIAQCAQMDSKQKLRLGDLGLTCVWQTH